MKIKLAIVMTLALAAWAGNARAYGGRVVDSKSRRPIADAIVTLGEQVSRTDRDGRFEINAPGEQLGVRAYGHLRAWVPVTAIATGRDIALEPFTPKALYLSFFGVGHTGIRTEAMHLVENTELNAVTIDVKGDRGMVAYKSSVPLAAQVGAQDITTVRDMKALLAGLQDKHIYTVARIVVFKDDKLALARPELAVKRRDGSTYRDRERLAWADPFRKEVWDYNIAIAVEAAKHGFDEIQFDYLRFPDAPGLVYSELHTEANRVNAINGFLKAARKALAPYNVFLAVDIFGYVCWNLDDTHIGQQLEDLPASVDYISPMLYPSCFQFGIPGYRIPVQHPYEIVHLTLDNALKRTGIAPVRFRPWIQAFRDYAFDRRDFGAVQIRAQINGAEEFGSDGWMLWNPRNQYTDAGLKK
jgi:hypothetical protein